MPPITKASASGGLLLGNVPGGMVSVTWSPTPAILAAQYVKLGLDIRSFREPLTRSVREVMSPSIRKNFDVEGRPSWPALSDVTRTIREYYGFPGGPILKRKGTLKKVAGQINIWTIDSEKAFISDLRQASYGIIHQTGARFTPRSGGGAGMSELARTAMRKRGKVVTSQAEGPSAERRAVVTEKGGGSNTIPARPFLLIQDEDVAAIEDVFERWLRERVARAGFRPGVG
jgi:phage gpG-like protein